MNTHKETTEQMTIKIDHLQSELTSHASKFDRGNKMLQAGMRQLSADSRRIHAEIQAEQASQKSQILEMSKQLKVIREAVLTIAERN
jgi:hypothetical protein